MFSTITAPPAKQSVSETISVLSGRLSTATLLEDRRAAILGLRSFAKQYPASVASGALRSLIGSLDKDGEDVDTVKVVLETLLMLFNPNEDSPEASEEIALWLADEFTQRQGNISLLLNFVESNDFYSRLYSLQLLSVILAARTARTEESILDAPLSIPRIVGTLEDRREAVRNAAISLLTDLTPASVVIQNSVAFESAFERVFKIMADEGGLVEGARAVEDCLILLANLLRLNPSNQSMFREMGYISLLGRLLERVCQQTKDGDEEVAVWVVTQRNRNLYALLAVIRLFLVPGAVGTSQNQDAFLRDRVLESTLQLAFTTGLETQIRSEALETCADMIRGNARLQESFAGLQVISPLATTAAVEKAQTNGANEVFVIDGLLDLTLCVHDTQLFDMRVAASACLKAYFCNHSAVRLHFLRRAIEGHKSEAREATNILTTLLEGPGDEAVSDPYRVWFAAVLMLHLVHENPMTKALAMAVTEGDEANGEEVVTSIQTITAHFLSSANKSDDVRILVGYLMLLLCWLFEDMDAVNDFLGEASNVPGLIQAAVQDPSGDVMVQGLCAMLLGVIYEFSTKDTPVSRLALREIIMSKMGRDRYIDKMARLRSHALMRDFEVKARSLQPGIDQRQPDVFLDEKFVEFFKDNYSRILRAIDREPGLEISVVTNGVQKGISRELVDSLRAQVEEKERALQDAEVEKASLRRQFGQEQADHRRTQEANTLEVSRNKEALAALEHKLEAWERDGQENELARNQLAKQLSQAQTELQQALVEIAKMNAAMDELQKKREDETSAAEVASRAKEQAWQQQLDAARKAAETDAERMRRRHEAEKADLKATISRLEVDIMKANKAKASAEAKASELETQLKTSAEKLADAESHVKTLEVSIRDGQEKMAVRVKEKEEEKKAVQGELDDLLMVFEDLSEKANKYQERLKALGESVSDDEGGDDAD